jgi:hypothetical protein
VILLSLTRLGAALELKPTYTKVLLRRATACEKQDPPALEDAGDDALVANAYC